MIEALLWGLGLVLLIEGLVYGLAPHVIDQLLEQLKSMHYSARRIFGLGTALAGAMLLWVVRAFF